MIRFSCPKCAAELKVPDDFLASVVACPKCKTPIKIPEKVPNAGGKVSAPRRRHKITMPAPGGIPLPIWIGFAANAVFRFIDSYVQLVYIPRLYDAEKIPDEGFGWRAAFQVFCWLLAGVLWLGILAGSGSARLTMKTICWLVVAFSAMIYASSIIDPVQSAAKARGEISHGYVVFAGVFSLAIVVLLSLKSSKRYTT